MQTAEVAIVGGGVIGCSIAYHLAARGMKNVVVFEREELLGMGSTAKCAGGGNTDVVGRRQYFSPHRQFSL